MYKLLIADDEIIEREALKYIIKNSSLDIGEIYEAANGQEVISTAAIASPDIIILDINMPGLNGIEAAKILRRINSENKIVFLTAYDQFEFAHEAIKIGVEEFMVKPASDVRVIEVMQKVIDQLENQKKMHIQQKHMEEKLSQVSKYLEGEFVSSIVMGEIDEEHAKDYLNFMMTDFQQGFGVVIQLDFYNEGHISPLQKNMIKKRFIEKLSDEIAKKNIKYLLNHVRYTIYLLIFGYPKDNKDFCEGAIRDKIQVVKEALGEQIAEQIYVGIGNEYTHISELWKSFSQAKIAARNAVLVLEESENVSDQKVDSLDLKEKELCESILEGKEAEMIHIVDDILDNIIYTSNDMNEIRLALYEFLILLNRSLCSDSKCKIQHKTPEKVFNSLRSVYSKGEAKMYIHEYLLNIMEEVMELKTDKTRLILEKAVKYIHEHYAENISLEYAADICGFSTYYFCKMFKKYYHVSFTDYLSNVRMQKAKQLLRDPRINMKDITEMIGYIDPNYFTRVFKKYEGMTPTEYRNKILLSRN